MTMSKQKKKAEWRNIDEDELKRLNKVKLLDLKDRAQKDFWETTKEAKKAYQAYREKHRRWLSVARRKKEAENAVLKIIEVYEGER